MIIAVLIVCMSISFYFLKILPQRQHSKDSISYQDKCGAQSRIAYKDLTSLDPSSDSTPDGLNYSFENHYNSKLNKCFILLYINHWDETLGNTSDETLFDSYGLNKIASFSESKNITKNTDHLWECNINDKKVCSTLDEFTSLIQPYMAD